MRENGLIQQDVAKVHNEINILVNIRILLALGAVTAVGLTLRNINFEKIASNSADSISLLDISAIWLIVIAIQYASLGAWTKIRSCATYLRINNYSTWERGWHRFRFPLKNSAHETLRKSILSIDGNGFGSVYWVCLSGIMYSILIVVWHYIVHDKAFDKLAENALINGVGFVVLIFESVAIFMIMRKQRWRESIEFELQLEELWRTAVSEASAESESPPHMP